MPGYVNTQPSNPAACDACGIGHFCHGQTHRESCPQFQTTVGETSKNQSDCLCQAGNFPSQESCDPCPSGQFKRDIGNVTCSKCPQGRFSGAVGASDSLTCEDCQSDKTTAEDGAASELECKCRSGLYERDGSCLNCKVGFYCPGTGLALACPLGETSRQGSKSESDCFCKAGRYRSGSTCTLCPRGRYKQVDDDLDLCPFQCPTNADSNNGSKSLSDCFCMPGHYADIDADGLLARCVDCISYKNLECRGGFQELNLSNVSQAGVHVLPVAKKGFFQTGVILAVKCNAVVDDGSACLGGEMCGDEDTQCVHFKNYLSRCADGSTGVLCGECPVGWGRESFKAPCQPCGDSPILLILSILIDVLMKAMINCVLALRKAVVLSQALQSG